MFGIKLHVLVNISMNFFKMALLYLQTFVQLRHIFQQNLQEIGMSTSSKTPTTQLI